MSNYVRANRLPVAPFLTLMYHRTVGIARPDFQTYLYLTEYRHPIRTGDIFSVAVLGQDRLLYIGAGQKVTKEFIDNLGYAVKHIAVRDPLVVVGCGGGDSKFIPLVAVPLRYRPFGTGGGTHPG